MCEKLKYCNPRIDNCLKEIIKKINKLTSFKTLASCCGHNEYHPTIIVKDTYGNVFEFFSRNKLIVKKRNRYYKKDENGFYFIPYMQYDKILLHL